MTDSRPWLRSAPIPPADFRQIRRHLMFHACKWDPQVGDVSALCPTPLVLHPHVWPQLAAWSQLLYSECLASERALCSRPDLHSELALPGAIRRLLSHQTPAPRDLARIMRFDFHFTTQGWRISEVNCDVPGGFIEASAFTQQLAAHTGHQTTGDPTTTLVSTIANSLRRPAQPTSENDTRPLIALTHATAYVDDAQVMHHLAAAFSSAGLRPLLTSPSEIPWNQIDALVRFYPAEWLPRLAHTAPWQRFFLDPDIPQCNPATSLLIQSKRWPLLWDQLQIPVPTWRQLLPITQAPSRALRTDPDRWILKSALGRVGDGVAIPGVTDSKLLKAMHRALRWGSHRHWIMQERFTPVPWETDQGPLYPCLGVYVIAGQPAGIYGRASPLPLIDHRAQDLTVLQAAPTPHTSNLEPNHLDAARMNPRISGPAGICNGAEHTFNPLTI